VPLNYGAYAPSNYGGSCRPLRLQAQATGNVYWWDRYQACRIGY
jgi:hypothetical protein